MRIGIGRSVAEHAAHHAANHVAHEGAGVGAATTATATAAATAASAATTTTTAAATAVANLATARVVGIIGAGCGGRCRDDLGEQRLVLELVEIAAHGIAAGGLPALDHHARV